MWPALRKGCMKALFSICLEGMKKLTKTLTITEFRAGVLTFVHNVLLFSKHGEKWGKVYNLCLI
jgi:hypothetical protein